MEDGNLEPEKERWKECPFNGKWCGDWCARYVTIFQIRNGQRVQRGMCVDVANNIMISEINQKTQPPQQKQPQILLPDLRG